MERKKLDTTLTLIIKGDKVLLAEKKRGFAAGKINAFGGKLEKGETIEQAMIRETQEECGVTPVSYKKVGEVEYDMYYKGEKTLMNMFVYICDKYEGEIIETEEMKPIWFDLDKVPFDRMFDNDRIWLPLVLEGKKIKGKCKFDKDDNEISRKIKEVSFF